MKKKQNCNTLTRAYIKEALQNKLSLSSEDASRILEAIIYEINHSILNEKYLKIFSFGTFLVHEKKERIGRNPKTKEESIITPRKSVSFRASAELRSLVNTETLEKNNT
jgi:integration host factor subunit alpha